MQKLVLVSLVLSIALFLRDRFSAEEQAKPAAKLAESPRDVVSSAAAEHSQESSLV
jgi:hypothetical protein